MQFFLLGLVALIAVLYFTGRFANANPAVLARRARVAAGVAAMAGAVLLLLRGLVDVAVPLAMLASWLIWGPRGMPWPWGSLPGTGSHSPGQRSRVRTDHIEMELDHDTGAISGQILKGIFAGRRIESMRAAELVLLWQDCRRDDPQSAQIIEAYLDRTYPTWRDDLARGEAKMGRGPDGRMTVEEAYEILGLERGAGEDDIRRAHRELMLKLHPDRGGSTYLASKINEAKEVLLGRKH